MAVTKETPSSLQASVLRELAVGVCGPGVRVKLLGRCYETLAQRFVVETNMKIVKDLAVPGSGSESREEDTILLLVRCV